MMLVVLLSKRVLRWTWTQFHPLAEFFQETTNTNLDMKTRLLHKSLEATGGMCYGWTWRGVIKDANLHRSAMLLRIKSLQLQYKLYDFCPCFANPSCLPFAQARLASQNAVVAVLAVLGVQPWRFKLWSSLYSLFARWMSQQISSSAVSAAESARAPTFPYFPSCNWGIKQDFNFQGYSDQERTPSMFSKKLLEKLLFGFRPTALPPAFWYIQVHRVILQWPSGHPRIICPKRKQNHAQIAMTASSSHCATPFRTPRRTLFRWKPRSMHKRLTAQAVMSWMQWVQAGLEKNETQSSLQRLAMNALKDCKLKRPWKFASNESFCSERFHQ